MTNYIALIRKRCSGRGYKCERCGSLETLGVHHPLPRSLFPELEHDLSNQIVLCQKCHDLCEPERIHIPMIKALREQIDRNEHKKRKLESELRYYKEKPPKTIYIHRNFDEEAYKQQIWDLKEQIKALQHLDQDELYVQLIEQRVRIMIEHIKKHEPDFNIPDSWKID